MDSFYDEFQPLSAYSMSLRDGFVFTDRAELEGHFDKTAVMLSFIESNEDLMKDLRNHIGRIPVLSTIDSRAFEISELYIVKKFLFNYSKVFGFLNDEVIKAFDVSFSSTELHELLRKDKSQHDNETFYISANYSDELTKVRKKIQDLDLEIKTSAQDRKDVLFTKNGLNFEHKDFLVIGKSDSKALDSNDYFLEPYDAQHFIVKVVNTDEHLGLLSTREELIQQEKIAERDVIKMLSETISKESVKLTQYIATIKDLDVHLAKAAMCLKFNLKRPRLNEYSSPIAIKNGRLVPLEAKCKKMKVDYTPLTTNVSNRINVIHGSNMGGKTVILKSVAFLQLLTQMGFYIPADDYNTVIFDHLFYIGDDNDASVDGLSSFGMEMYNFIESTKEGTERSLYLLDEFARTTNTKEAEALISGILNSFVNSERYAFFSTHYMNLPASNNVSFYRMKGLNKTSFEEYYGNRMKHDFKDRIKMINDFMEYEMVEDDGSEVAQDAISVAELLGMDNEIISKAKEHLKG